MEPKSVLKADQKVHRGRQKVFFQTSRWGTDCKKSSAEALREAGSSQAVGEGSRANTLHNSRTYRIVYASGFVEHKTF